MAGDRLRRTCPVCGEPLREGACYCDTMEEPPLPKEGRCSTAYEDGTRCEGVPAYWAPGARAWHLLCESCAADARVMVYRLDLVPH